MKKSFRLIASLAFLATPLIAAAQSFGSTGINVKYLQQFSESIVWIINYLLVPALMALAFIVFLWGVYKYFIYGADNDTERETGRKFTLWGVIGFVVILSLWGIVNLLMGTLGLSAGKAPPYPTIGTPPSGTSNTSPSTPSNIVTPTPGTSANPYGDNGFTP